MAEDFINDIYSLAEVIPKVREIIIDCRHYDEWSIEQKWPALAASLTEYCMKMNEYSEGLGTGIYSVLSDICSNTKGWRLFGDRLEKELMPLLYKGALQLGGIDVTEGNWQLLSSDSGYLTVRRISDGILLHSSFNPVEEADILARQLYNPRYQRFYILGCGLGYLAKALYEISGGAMELRVFEKAGELVNYARSYGVLSDIPAEKLRVFSSDNDECLINEFTEDATLGEQGYIGYYVEKWELDYFWGKRKSNIEEFRLVQETARREYQNGLRNFYNNTFNVKDTVNELKKICNGDEWSVVAAGPSVDKCIEDIKKYGKSGKLIVVSTILQRMENEGITPDLVTVQDPQNKVFEHMKNVKNDNVPIVLGMIANWQYAEKYHGKKYLAPTKGMPEIEDFIKMHLLEGWNTGSTVTSLAIETAVFLGAKTVHLFGVDLAYPGNDTHAEGVISKKPVTEKLHEVKSVQGGHVMTSEVFDLYIHEIEEQIGRHPNVTFINHSDCGAFINGTVRKQ